MASLALKGRGRETSGRFCFVNQLGGAVSITIPLRVLNSIPSQMRVKMAFFILIHVLAGLSKVSGLKKREESGRFEYAKVCRVLASFTRSPFLSYCHVVLLEVLSSSGSKEILEPTGFP